MRSFRRVGDRHIDRFIDVESVPVVDVKGKQVAEQTGLTADAEVEVSCENGAVVARLVSQPRYTLAELLGQMTDGSIHPETDTGEM